MDLMTAHKLLTMLELMDMGWEMNDYVVKEDDTVIVEIYREGEGVRTIDFERMAL